MQSIPRRPWELPPTQQSEFYVDPSQAPILPPSSTSYVSPVTPYQVPPVSPYPNYSTMPASQESYQRSLQQVYPSTHRHHLSSPWHQDPIPQAQVIYMLTIGEGGKSSLTYPDAYRFTIGTCHHQVFQSCRMNITSD